MKKLDKEKNKALKLTDALGKKIDKNILETVACLRTLGFETTASCEGHKKRGLPGPWIDIETKELQEYIDKYYWPIWEDFENNKISIKVREERIKKIENSKDYKKLKLILVKDIEKILFLIDEFNYSKKLTTK